MKYLEIIHSKQYSVADKVVTDLVKKVGHFYQEMGKGAREVAEIVLHNYELCCQDEKN